MGPDPSIKWTSYRGSQQAESWSNASFSCQIEAAVSLSDSKTDDVFMGERTRSI